MKKYRGWIFGILLLLLVVGGGYAWWQIRLASSSLREGRNGVSGNLTLPVGFQSVTQHWLNPLYGGWKQVPVLTVPLIPQVMFVPWGRSEGRTIQVKAIHDQAALALRLSWKDETKNNQLTIRHAFPDGVAVMLPLKKMVPASIMMGFLEPVNIWHWKAARRHEMKERVYADFHIPYETGTILGEHRADRVQLPLSREIVDNLARMPGTLTEKEVQAVYGESKWQNGYWYVTFLRKLKTPREIDSQLKMGETGGIAFAVWDGAKRERGARKSISDWVELFLVNREGKKS